MEIEERSSLAIEDELNFVSNCNNKIRYQHKNIVKKISWPIFTNKIRNN